MGSAVGTVMNLTKSAVTTISAIDSGGKKDGKDVDDKDDDKDRDPRRRNSLAFYVSQFVNYEGDEFAKVIEAVKADKYAKTGGKPPNVRNSSNSLIAFVFSFLLFIVIVEFSKIADGIISGNFKELRNQVFVYFKTINRHYKDHHLGNTILHMICQEGYYNMLTYMANPENRSGIDDGVYIDYTAKNDKNRIPLFLCFTPPTATVSVVALVFSFLCFYFLSFSLLI
jgi:hypothetical protein